MKYIYGPVRSRRLGLSLGVSLVKGKACNFSCVYCQLGRTEKLTVERAEYVSPEEILAELKSWLTVNPQEAQKLDFITLSGSGEPTLNSAISEVIRGIKKLSLSKVAVLTNSSLLGNPQVRRQLIEADLIVPSLDAVTPEAFAAVDRPHKSIKIESIIDGLIALRKEFGGRIWLEVLLVAGVNDSPEQIKKLKEAVDRIRPDKVQINSPVRATAEKIQPVERKKLEGFKRILGDNCEIV